MQGRSGAAARAHPRGRFTIESGGRSLEFATQAGVFSHDGPDEGSMLLLKVATPLLRPHMSVLDLGCGVGLLGLAVAPLLTRGEVWCADSDIRAVRLAEDNARVNGLENVHVVLSDITLDLPLRQRFDLVLSNPPTHSGKEVLAHFVDESCALLRPGGRLLLVVNRLLSVRDTMAATFGAAETLERRHGFLILSAVKERRRPGERDWEWESGE